MAYTEEAMRERFHEVNGAIDAIEKQTAPMRAERDDLLAKYEPRCRELEKGYRKIEEPLYALKNERSLLLRSLKGSVRAVQAETAVFDAPTAPVPAVALVQYAVPEPDFAVPPVDAPSVKWKWWGKS